MAENPVGATPVELLSSQRKRMRIRAAGLRRRREDRVESNKSGLFFLKLKVVWFSEKTPKLKIVPAM